MPPKIIKYNDNLKEQVLAIWEQSVLATHQFLAPTDFETIKKLVRAFDFTQIDVYCLVEEEKLRGFIGGQHQKIEMLFLAPQAIGKGYGRKLLEYSIEKLNANKVDVNEQNTKAVAFYQKCGFCVYERTECDDLELPYPLLRMKMENKRM